MAMLVSLSFEEGARPAFIAIGVGFGTFACLLFAEIALGLGREVEEAFPVPSHEDEDEDEETISKTTVDIPVTRIRGVGPVLELRFWEIGLNSVEDVAGLTVDEAIELGAPAGLRSRRRWEEWIEDANRLLEVDWT